MNKRAANNQTKSRNNNVAAAAETEQLVETAAETAAEIVETAEDKGNTAEIAAAESAAAEIIETAAETVETGISPLSYVDLPKTAEKTAEKTAAEKLAEIAAAKEVLAKAIEEARTEKEKQRAAAKEAKEVERASAELAAMQDALSKLKSAPIEEEEEDSDAEEKGEFKMTAEERAKFFLKSLAACGNDVAKIGILRAYWMEKSADFRAIPTDKQRKAIMRRTLNALLIKRVVGKEGNRIYLEKTTESK